MHLRYLAFLIISLGTVNANAYTEYAARYNVISCTACHISPVGGGPKTLYGKLFGAHGYKINPALAQDYISADFRALYYYPQKVTSSNDGFGVMAAAIAGHVALDEEKRIHLVIEENTAGFAAATTRDTYALIKFGDEGKINWVESLLVGRFRAPFGLGLDEHRTYTRIETATEWYTFESGLMLSGGDGDQFHYDAALVTGENSGGQSLPPGEATRFGGILNLRWMPGPVLLGLSGSYHQHDPNSESRKAISFYGVISVARMTNDRIPLAINLEVATAWGWDSNLGRGFAASSDYVTSLGLAQAQGYLALFDYYLTPRLILVYKMDYLVPDKNYPADSYLRNGLGVKYFFGPNANVQIRSELARATPPSESGSTMMAAQNATFAILQLGF